MVGNPPLSPSIVVPSVIVCRALLSGRAPWSPLRDFISIGFFRGCSPTLNVDRGSWYGLCLVPPTHTCRFSFYSRALPSSFSPQRIFFSSLKLSLLLPSEVPRPASTNPHCFSPPVFDGLPYQLTSDSADPVHARWLPTIEITMVTTCFADFRLVD